MMNKALSTLNKQTKKTFLFITVASFRNSETSSHNQDIVQGDESCNIYLILFFYKLTIVQLIVGQLSAI